VGARVSNPIAAQKENLWIRFVILDSTPSSDAQKCDAENGARAMKSTTIYCL
jgi:hypothetical protein